MSIRMEPCVSDAGQEMRDRRRFAEHQLPTPNYRTVMRRVAAVDARLAATRREGAKAARDKFGPIGASNLRPQRPMEVLQIDHTPVDVIVVDQEQRRPYRDPHLCNGLLRCP
jgi:putative transposase